MPVVADGLRGCRCGRSQAALVVLACVAVLVLSFAAAATANAKTGGTSIHLYTPFNGGVTAKGVRIAKTVTGYCWTTSSSDTRSDAYRCFVGNFIHDPCFANNLGSANYVLCPLSFPGSKVLRIRLTRSLPAANPSSNPMRYPPWALQLAGGRWCEILSGATGVIAGVRINYGCAGGGILLGNPRRGSKTWTIFHAKSFNSSSFAPVKIRSVWW